MKKIKLLFMLLIIAMGMLVIGCDKEQDQEELETIKVLVPGGAPLIAFGNLLDNKAFKFDLAQSADALSAGLLNTEYDMIVAPLNLGAKLSISGKTSYKLEAIITTNNTYLVSKNEINSVKDLAGLNILAYGKNATPDIIFKSALEKNNVTVGNIAYQASVGDVLSLFMANSSEATYSLLAEPQVTIIKEKNPNVYVLDMVKEIEEGKVFPQACLYIKENSNVTEKHLELMKQNINKLNNNPKEYTESVLNKHTYFKGIGSEVLEKALPNCNIVYLKAKENKEIVNEYIVLLNKYAPNLLGGKTIDEGFYY